MEFDSQAIGVDAFGSRDMDADHDAAADDIDLDLSSPRDREDVNNSCSLLSALAVTNVPTIVISDSTNDSDEKTTACIEADIKGETELVDSGRDIDIVILTDDSAIDKSEKTTPNHNINPDIDTSVNNAELVSTEYGLDGSDSRARGSDNALNGQVSAEFSDVIVTGGERNTENEFTGLKDINSDTNLKDELELEADAINLDNILMKEKQESDSDSEFDFDLPSAPAAKTPEVSKEESPKPAVVVSKAEETKTRTDPVTAPDTTNAAVSPKSKPLAFVKPTPQALGFSYSEHYKVFLQLSGEKVEKKEPEGEKQQGLEAAQSEWDKVTTIQPGFKDVDTREGSEPVVVKTIPSISPYELAESLMQADFTSVRPTIRPAMERRGFAAFINMLFGPPKLTRSLLEERDKVFCIAASPLDNENSSHLRTLQTIYRSLTGSKFDCPRVGSHWEEIGFQGSDPATDLRGTGVLGLLNLLYLLRDPKKQTLASDIYRMSLHPSQNFPFCVMGINMTKITLQTMREEVLNKECNRRGDILSVVNEFYVGLYLQLYQVWKGQGKTISDSGYVIKDLEMRAKKNPRGVLKNLEEYLNKKTTIVVEQKTADFGGDNFVNVCD